MQPLAHLCAPMCQQHTAVSVHIHQGAVLVGSLFSSNNCPTWLRWTAVKAIPNFTGIMDRPRFFQRFLELKAFTYNNKKRMTSQATHLLPEALEAS